MQYRTDSGPAPHRGKVRDDISILAVSSPGILPGTAQGAGRCDIKRLLWPASVYGRNECNDALVPEPYRSLSHRRYRGRVLYYML